MRQYMGNVLAFKISQFTQMKHMPTRALFSSISFCNHGVTSWRLVYAHSVSAQLILDAINLHFPSRQEYT